jgi:hypothetical protein
MEFSPLGRNTKKSAFFCCFSDWPEVLERQKLQQKENEN